MTASMRGYLVYFPTSWDFSPSVGGLVCAPPSTALPLVTCVQKNLKPRWVIALLFFSFQTSLHPCLSLGPSQTDPEGRIAMHVVSLGDDSRQHYEGGE